MTALWTRHNDQLLLNQHPGQLRAWDAKKRIVAILAGTQGGKTSFLPWLLWREVQRCGPGDYIAATASYDLFKLKFLPALREVFEHLFQWGRYWSGDRLIELADPATGKFLAKRADDPMWGRIILRSAESGGGLESATAKAALLDEAGQESFTLETWEAVQRRTALYQGRIFLGTTIYNMGWLKQQVYDPWEKAKRQHPEIDVIQFDSTENPSFPREEYDKARANMPMWKFDMFYRGRYSRPAGLIYDAFNEDRCVCPPFAIPATWQRFMGLDFGGVNTAALIYAEEPTTKKLYLYREYWAGGLTAKEHAKALLAIEPMVPFCVGGSKSEDQWRKEFRAGGLPVNGPDIKEVEVGIDRVYGAHKRDEIVVFNTCTGYLNQKRSYAREVDSAGEPTEKIDSKSTYHFMDAERYVIGRIRRGQ